MKSILLAVIAVFTLASCSSSFKVTHVTKEFKPKNCNGIYYNLPQTFIIVDVTVKKNTLTEGPYAAYAEQYLGIKNAIGKSSMSYELADMKISSSAVQDPNQYYFIELKKNMFSQSKINLELNEFGAIKSVNAIDEKNQNSKKLPENNNKINTQEGVRLHNVINSNIIENTDTIIDKTSQDTAIAGKKTLKINIEEKSLEQKAKEDADFIMKIKKDRYDLISGLSEVNYEKGSFEIMNNELTKIENDYLNLFTGQTTTAFEQYRFTFIPDAKSLNQAKPIFYFSSNNGISLQDSINNTPVNLIAEKHNVMNSLDSSIIQRNSNKKYNKGLYYRIPDQATITIKYKNEIKAEKELLINQFGLTTNLPQFDNKVIFYPKSGTIKSIDFE